MLPLPKVVVRMALLALLLPTAMANAGMLAGDGGPCVYAVTSDGARQTGPFFGAGSDTILVGVRSAEPAPGFELGVAVRPTRCASSSPVSSSPLLP